MESMPARRQAIVYCVALAALLAAATPTTADPGSDPSSDPGCDGGANNGTCSPPPSGDGNRTAPQSAGLPIIVGDPKPDGSCSLVDKSHNPPRVDMGCLHQTIGKSSSTAVGAVSHGVAQVRTMIHR